MSLLSEQIEKLTVLRKTYKFSEDEWKARWLSPSVKSVCDKMDILINECVDELLDLCEKDVEKENYRIVLTRGLQRFDSTSFNIQEREFAGDLISRLGDIVDYDIDEEIEEWMNESISFNNGIFQEKKELQLLKTQTVSCKNCNSTLSQQLLEKEEGVLASWEIARCKNCGELAVFDTPKNIKRTKLKNCTWERSYLKVNVSEPELENKLEELRKWFE